MPVYNGEKYLHEAIDSILAQSWRDFELIIVNDASTDGTEAIIRGYDDRRLISTKNDRNLGVPGSLNRGLALAKGKFIARMDADDIALPDRLEKQVRYLESRPEIGLLGTAVMRIDETGKDLGAYAPPADPWATRWKALWSNPHIHPTVMVRAEALAGQSYREEPKAAEDYELWSRLIFERGIRTANLAEPLLRYRQHVGSVTMDPAYGKTDSFDITMKNMGRYLELSDKDRELILKTKRQEFTLPCLLEYRRFQQRLRAAFIAKEDPPRETYQYFSVMSPVGLSREWLVYLAKKLRK